MGATACSARDAPPTTSPLTRSNARSGPKYAHMTLASFFTGTRRATVGRNQKHKSPVRRRRGPENPCTRIQRTRNLFGSPARGGLKIRDSQTMVAVRLKPRITMLLKCRMLFAMPATQPDRTTPVCEPFHNGARCVASPRVSPPRIRPGYRCHLPGLRLLYIRDIAPELSVYRGHPIPAEAAIVIFDKTLAKYESIVNDLRDRQDKTLR